MSDAKFPSCYNGINRRGYDTISDKTIDCVCKYYTWTTPPGENLDLFSGNFHLVWALAPILCGGGKPR